MLPIGSYHAGLGENLKKANFQVTSRVTTAEKPINASSTKISQWKFHRNEEERYFIIGSPLIKAHGLEISKYRNQFGINPSEAEQDEINANDD